MSDMRLYAQLIEEINDTIHELEKKLDVAFNDSDEADADSVLMDDARRLCAEGRARLRDARETLARYQGLKLFEDRVPVG